MDGHGVPLSLLVTAANRHDVSELAARLEARGVAPVPDEAGGTPTQNRCADAGYGDQLAAAIITCRRNTKLYGPEWTASACLETGFYGARWW